MISRSHHPPPEASTGPDAGWLGTLSARFTDIERLQLARALELAGNAFGARTLPSGEPVLEHVRGTAEILNDLRMDCETLQAALLMDLPQFLDGWRETVASACSPGVAELVDGVARMAQIHALSGALAGRGAERTGQAEALRKMLLAMVQDIRVVLIKLAERSQALKKAVARGAPDAVALAHEALDLFAPLANRIGVWQLKWELEDRAFHVLEPDTYKSIARLLDERRGDRERYISGVIALLKEELGRAGIEGEITGRPKHIYSIYKKMRRKQVGFEEIYDARAVRILVPEVKDCYAVLGIVHNLWQPIPKEFDDYIAKPKGNNYRSLHTAVIGPEGKALEVQIRTHEMHQHSELGVAAHWRYKEGAGQSSSYDDKIAWVRQILEWKDEVADSEELAEQFKTALFQDTIYVLTPQGKVIDLPRGSTPVDFAYHVHSDLGHRCRGARVNGAIVPLTYRLENAQRVEIVTTKQGGPSRDWLNPELGYLKSPRARAKVRQWFKALNLEQTLADGRAIVERELQRKGMSALSLDKLAERLHCAKVEDLLAAVARGEINTRQLALAMTEGGAPAAPAPEDAVPVRRSVAASGTGILVGGVGDLLTVFAKCCRPAPPDAIAGYVTRGRGVSVHRQDCATLARLAAQHADRLIPAEWSVKSGMTFGTDVVVEAQDRSGLLRDIYEVLSREKINITAANTLTRNQVARMFFTLEVSGLDQLKRVLALVRDVPGVYQASRK